MSCRRFEPLLGPFGDGELVPERILEVEQHLVECGLCQERLRLNHAVRGSLRRLVLEASQPSPAFRARLRAAIDAEQQREWETRVLAKEAERSRMLSWRTILPVAAAALTVLGFAASTGEQRRADRISASYARADATGVDEILEELVNHHERGRAEVTEQQLLPRFEKEVGVPVRAPNLLQYGARWEGGSIIPVRNQRAASLRYTMGKDHRFTLYVYDSSRFPIEQRLQQRYVGDEAVYVGTRRGYSIGVTEHGRIGYAVASDLNDAETAEIVAALDR